VSSPVVLVTGASGMVGKALISKLLASNDFSPIAAVRDISNIKVDCPVVYFDLEKSNCMPDLTGVEVVVHTAARVHVMDDDSLDTLSDYRRLNVQGTIELAIHAAKLGVKRFIFLSSIKVNGERSFSDKPFTEADEANPIDPYARSKYEAETALVRIGAEYGLEIVIIRPPLIYGPGVKANFYRMLSIVEIGLPLPFGCINNRRSFIAIDNLVSFICECIHNRAAADQLFLVSDDHDLSTPELLVLIASSFNKGVILYPVPMILLKMLASALGKKNLMERLCDCLQVDITKSKNVLGWEPQVSVTDAFRQTVKHYIRSK